MRGGTAFNIVGTMGAGVNVPSLTVGNGLCAVPLRCNYNPCGQNGTTHRHVIPSERSESRNPPKWQILPCGGTFLPRGGFLHSANAAVGMTKWGDVSGFYRKQFRPSTCGTAHRPFPTVSLGGGHFQPTYSKDERYCLSYCRNDGRKGKTSVPQKLSIVHCPLSIVNCQLGTTVHCPLSTFLPHHTTLPPAFATVIPENTRYIGGGRR